MSEKRKKHNLKLYVILNIVSILILFFFYQIFLTFNSIQISKELIEDTEYREIISTNSSNNFTLNLTTKTKNISVLLTGDSIAYGVGASSINYSLHYHLLDYFKYNYNNYNIRVENRAKIGNKIDDLINQTQKNKRGEEEKYNITIIVIGSNDVLYFTPFSIFEENMKTVLKQYSNVSKDIVIIGPGRLYDTTGLPITLRLIYDKTSHYYSQIYKNLASENENIVYINPLNNSLNISSFNNTLAQDGIHPNNEGHKYWQEMIVQGIKKTQSHKIFE
ncbi:MAG: SGNH/GDSL hydrolase family protein [Candidatus Nanoarchaeia archaeon]